MVLENQPRMKSKEYSKENPVPGNHSSASKPSNKHFLNIPASIAKLQIPSSHKLIYGELHAISLWHRKQGRRCFNLTTAGLARRCGISPRTAYTALQSLRTQQLIFYVRSKYCLHFKIIEDAADAALPTFEAPTIEETLFPEETIASTCLKVTSPVETDYLIENNELSTFEIGNSCLQIQENDFLIHEEVVDNTPEVAEVEDTDSNLGFEEDLGKSLLYFKPLLISRLQLLLFHWFSSQTTPDIAAANRKLVYRFVFFCGLDVLERIINSAEDSGITNSGGYVSKSLRNGISAALN